MKEWHLMERCRILALVIVLAAVFGLGAGIASTVSSTQAVAGPSPCDTKC
jgi:hypothetical protein